VRPPVLYNNLLEVNGLVGTWLYACMSDHEQCRLVPDPGPFKAEVVELPRRLLSISAVDGNLSVKLVQTKGTTGHYCALSYCWGAPDRHPLRTTRSNLAEHLDGIPLDNLPATFRGALALTGGLNIGYLWIDSLCILQDDVDEWVQEVDKMGSIYQRASLVIIAAGSHDATEGLFSAERPTPSTFRFPFSGPAPVPGYAGCFNVAIRPNDHRQPNNGPLAKRGWAMQEWHLARRKVYFMPGGITWKCKVSAMNERGGDEDADSDKQFSWLSFLEEYTEKEFTFPTDRLLAVSGIVNEMRKSTNNAYGFGIWGNQIHEQLLWRFMGDSPSQQSVTGLPSWNWAATGGAKIWPLTRRDSLRDSKAVTGMTIDLSQPASLRISGSLVRANTSSIRYCCVQALLEKLQHFEGSEQAFYPSIEEIMLPGYGEADDSDKAESFMLTEVDHPNKPLGLAVFDQFKRFSEVFCLPLMSTRRQTQDPWYSHSR